MPSPPPLSPEQRVKDFVVQLRHYARENSETWDDLTAEGKVEAYTKIKLILNALTDIKPFGRYAKREHEWIADMHMEYQAAYKEQRKVTIAWHDIVNKIHSDEASKASREKKNPKTPHRDVAAPALIQSVIKSGVPLKIGPPNAKRTAKTKSPIPISDADEEENDGKEGEDGDDDDEEQYSDFDNNGRRKRSRKDAPQPKIPSNAKFNRKRCTRCKKLSFECYQGFTTHAGKPTKGRIACEPCYMQKGRCSFKAVANVAKGAASEPSTSKAGVERTAGPSHTRKRTASMSRDESDSRGTSASAVQIPPSSSKPSSRTSSRPPLNLLPNPSNLNPMRGSSGGANTPISPMSAPLFTAQDQIASRMLGLQNEIVTNSGVIVSNTSRIVADTSVIAANTAQMINAINTLQQQLTQIAQILSRAHPIEMADIGSHPATDMFN